MPSSPIGPDRHLDVTFWIGQVKDPGQAVMDAAQIARFNAHGFSEDPSLTDLAALPPSIPAAEARTLVQAMSRRNKIPLRFHSGGPVTEADYERYEADLNLECLQEPVSVQFGFVLRRTDMRTWPTEDTAYKNRETIDLDRFQENGLFPGDAVAIVHESRDGHWFFVCSYNYSAWVRKAHIALTSRETATAFGKAEPFMVVTGGKVTTNFNPRCPALSELQLDMGVRLPLAEHWPEAAAVDGQNPYTSYLVRMPVRASSGDAEFHTTLVARSQDVRLSYLEYTRENVLRQGFKFLGERYGWGHSYNARDCSGLVTDIYRSMGILLPRNTRQQVDSPLGQTTRFNQDNTREERLQAVDALEPGDLIYSPGHVMIYVGQDGGRPYVLHDTSSPIRFQVEGGGTFEGILNGVSITPFISLQDENRDHYLDTMWAIKKVH